MSIPKNPKAIFAQSEIEMSCLSSEINAISLVVVVLYCFVFPQPLSNNVFFCFCSGGIFYFAVRY